MSGLCINLMVCSFFFFFNDTATTEIYTLSLHDALPIYLLADQCVGQRGLPGVGAAHEGGEAAAVRRLVRGGHGSRSEEHTSELQSRQYLVCRLLLEKKKPTSRRFIPSLHKRLVPPLRYV